MSVSTVHYVVQGLFLKDRVQIRDFDYDDKYHDDEDIIDKNRLYVIVDGMNGKYVFIGRILARSDEFDGFDEIVEIPSLDKSAEGVLQAQIKDAFGLEGRIGTYAFTHWS